MPRPNPASSEQLPRDREATETSDSKMPDRSTKPDDAVERFDRLAEESSPSMLRQLFDFALENKKWWLIPIIVVLLLVAAFIVVSGTAGPFIYPLF